jgi:diguanylate cyclase (GGDEF)-like protein
MERQLNTGDRVLHAVGRGTAVVTTLVNADLSIAWVSDTVVDLLGYTSNELVGTSAPLLVHPDDVNDLLMMIADERVEPKSFADRADPARLAMNTMRLRHADGHWVLLDYAANNLLADPDVAGWVLQLVPAQLRAHVDAAMRSIIDLADTEGILHQIAATVEELIVGSTALVEAVGLRHDAPVWLTEFVDSNGQSSTDVLWRFEIELDAVPVGFIAVAMPPDTTHAPSLWVRQCIDRIVPLVLHLVRRERVEAALKAEADTDPLTGLANRRAFFRRGTEQIDGGDHDLAIVYLDLDDFKTINDRFGHRCGDHALVEVSHRITRAVRSADLVARIGGDEFAVLLRVDGAHTARELATSIADRLSTIPWWIDDQCLSLQASIGVAIDASASFDELLRRADAAMFDAKRIGSGHITVDIR